MTAPHDEKVSCLLVTLPVPERFGYFTRCVAAYCRQTHPSTELVIVFDESTADARAAILGHVASLRRPDIRLVEIPGKHTLGALRNASMDHATGDVLCQWDDDDLHHPQRVERQLAALAASGGQALCLEDVMQFFAGSRMLYWTNWRATPVKSFPGSLMVRRAAAIRYPETGADAKLGEDTVVSLRLQEQGVMRVLAGAPHLFVYVSHGANSWHDEHHRMLARELAISRALLARREASLREGLAPIDFGAGVVSVHGYNGLAFELRAASPA
jgi:glycosyltransferase involved in cell wall biosynthesis